MFGVGVGEFEMVVVVGGLGVGGVEGGVYLFVELGGGYSYGC